MNQRGSAIINTLMGVTIVFVLLAGIIAIHASVLQSWTGSGTVIGRSHQDASEGSMLMNAGSGVFFFMDTSSPESYRLTVRDDKGAEHPFSVTKDDYESTAVGAHYVRSK